MKLIIIVLPVAVALIALAALYFVVSVYYRFATRQSDREVASGVDVSTDWLELTPRPPLKATKHVQHLIILVDGYDRSPDDYGFQMMLPDGTAVNPDVEIMDEDGQSYRLHPSMLVSAGVGYTGGLAHHSSLPKDKSYTKIRIRSHKPFRALKVIWENMNLK